MRYEYPPCEIVTFVVSPPKHAYFGRPKDGPADEVETHTPDTVEIVADKGIRGDRFFGVKAHTEAAVTFLALEAWTAAAGDVDPPVSARRNVVVRGVELDRCAGGSSSSTPVPARSDSAAGVPHIRVRGWTPSPGEGVRKALIGRGGLRAQPLTSGGTLHIGPAVIVTDVELDAARAADQVKRAQPL